MAKGKYQKWLEPDGLILLEGWARDGLSEEQISHNMGINQRTLTDWKSKYSPISLALKKGREVVDYEVENALYKKATGFYIDEEHCDKDGNVFTIQRYYPPDTAALIFWLKNRRRHAWKDKPEDTDVTQSKVTITFASEEMNEYGD